MKQKGFLPRKIHLPTGIYSGFGGAVLVIFITMAIAAYVIYSLLNI